MVKSDLEVGYYFSSNHKGDMVFLQVKKTFKKGRKNILLFLNFYDHFINLDFQDITNIETLQISIQIIFI